MAWAFSLVGICTLSAPSCAGPWNKENALSQNTPFRITFFIPASLGLVDEGPLPSLRMELPLRPESLADLRIVHLRILRSHFPPLATRPDHEGVHGSLDVASLTTPTH